MDKSEIINFFNKNIRSISQWNHRGNLLEKLNENNIRFNDFDLISLNKEFSIYLFDLDKNFLKCKNKYCNNERTYVKFLLDCKKYEYGFKHFCSKKCLYKYRSYNQIGENNTSHNMTKEQKDNSYKKLSNTIKRKIKDGTWTPNITNSWAGSKIKLIIENKEISYRSSWEAFYHLCNQHLEYEKIRIPYIYNDIEHNYITDFTDEYNKIIYEIKPKKNIDNEKNKIKFKYANKWCKENGYKFIIISNDWFKNNYNNYKKLLENQKCKNIIEKRLKQFE